ncbi:hypothetical protein niasHT_013924 [Heterodera trifolii]|uniref:Odorant receptor n=1 Tax=Heterodera trifolii TaxID=157864 RepID=A0ABD2L235_9BILA
MFFFKPELYNRLYNCTRYDIAQIPLEQRLTAVQNTAQIFLALNRCIDLAYGNVFHGKHIYLWMIFCVIYGLYFFIFTMPIIFSSIIGTWFSSVFLISIINDAAATICALMNFLPVGNTLITLGQITWMLSFEIVRKCPYPQMSVRKCLSAKCPSACPSANVRPQVSVRKCPFRPQMSVRHNYP